MNWSWLAMLAAAFAGKHEVWTTLAKFSPGLLVEMPISGAPRLRRGGVAQRASMGLHQSHFAWPASIRFVSLMWACVIVLGPAPAFAANSPTDSVPAAVELPYGTADGEIGFEPGGTDTIPRGPLSFAVSEDGSLLVLDTVNGKLKRFEANGALLDVVDSVGVDLLVDAVGKTVTVASASQLVTYSLELRQVSVIETTNGGEILQKLTTAMPDGNEVAPSRTHPVCRLVNSHEAEIAIGEKTIRFHTDGNLGSASCLGADGSGNVFIATELLDAVDGVLNVTKAVHQISADSRVLATLPVDIDYAAYPLRELVMKDGVVYHMRPLTDRLRIEAWRPVAPTNQGEAP